MHMRDSLFVRPAFISSFLSCFLSFPHPLPPAVCRMDILLSRTQQRGVLPPLMGRMTALEELQLHGNYMGDGNGDSEGGGGRGDGDCTIGAAAAEAAAVAAAGAAGAGVVGDVSNVQGRGYRSGGKGSVPWMDLAQCKQLRRLILQSVSRGKQTNEVFLRLDLEYCLQLPAAYTTIIIITAYCRHFLTYTHTHKHTHSHTITYIHSHTHTNTQTHTPTQFAPSEMPPHFFDKLPLLEELQVSYERMNECR